MGFGRVFCDPKFSISSELPSPSTSSLPVKLSGSPSNDTSCTTMLHRSVPRALKCSPSSPITLPPTFLLPLRAHLATASPSSTTTTTRSTDPDAPPNAFTSRKASPIPSSPIPPNPLTSTASDPHLHTQTPSLHNKHPQLSRHTPSLRLSQTSPSTEYPQSEQKQQQQTALFKALAAQSPHYLTIHIHGHPYLVTQGDEIRLPFHMRNVTPGTILRINRASTLGSRDFTLRGGGGEIVEALVATPPSTIATTTAAGEPSSTTIGGEELAPREKDEEVAAKPSPWIDERLYLCRALVLGVEAEPMRFMEKTKRRQRHVKTVKSKGRFTVVRIVECGPQMPGRG